MAKYYGNIGYAMSIEDPPESGIWTQQITERNARGDIVRQNSRHQGSDKVNDNIIFNGEFSIIADPFAIKNFSSIIYVEYMGTKWKVTSATPQYPRIILSVGEVYNEH